MASQIINSDYRNWLVDLKTKIKQSQIKAVLAVNSQLIMLYWDLGKEIVEKQQNAKWGSGFIDQLSKDLKLEFPEIGGFSAKNLRYCKSFFEFYSEVSIWQQPVAKLENADYEEAKKSQQLDGELEIINNNENFHHLGGNIETKENSIWKQPVSKLQNQLFAIPWGHHILIIQKIKDVPEAIFYVQQTIENNWSRAVLEMQIETKLFNRQGKAITNFKETLPEIESDLANALMKDPYNLDFLTFGKKIKERDLEQQLIGNISSFLLELGKGFAYMGRQFLINVGGKEFRTDLLFYHTKLQCYIVIELKVTEFEPEYIGKLNFYLTAINELVKSDLDKPTIGILLCKTKNNLVVDFALKDINSPMGISEFTYTELSDEIKNALPTLEQLTNELNRENDL